MTIVFSRDMSDQLAFATAYKDMGFHRQLKDRVTSDEMRYFYILWSDATE